MGRPTKPFPRTPKLYRKDMRPIREEWRNHIDEKGLIVQHLKTMGGEGGDTLQRVGMMKTVLEILKKETNYDTSSYPYDKDEEFHKALNWLEHERRKGQYRRHPNSNHWTGRWGTHSTRDQQRPLLTALGSSKSAKRLWQMFWRHLSRRALLFTDANRKNHQWEDRLQHEHHTDGPWNGDKWRFPDPTGPMFWASYVRGLINIIGEYVVGVAEVIAMVFMIINKVDPVWFLCLPAVFLSILDLQMLVDSILNSRKKKSSEINFIIDLAWANHMFPTPLVYLAKIIYAFKVLPGPPEGGYQTDRVFGPNAVMDHYFRPAYGGGPLNRVWKILINQWMYPPKHWFWGKIRKWAEHKI